MKNLTMLHIVGSVMMLLTSCGSNYTPVTINRLDQRLSSGTLPKDSAFSRATHTLFLVSGYGEPTDSTVRLYSEMPSIASHTHAVDSVFTDLSAEATVLGNVMGRLGEIIPDFRVPEIFAIISPFNQSVITADSILFIGLNHYLGSGYEPYGYFPDYIRRRKEPARIPVDVAETLIRAYRPYKPSVAYPTLLSRMIFEGAVTQGVMEAASVSMTEALGYSPEEEKWLEANETDMWNSLLTRDMLYSTDPTVARGMTALSPATTILAPDAPGAAGRWIGARIVGAYLKNNPSASLNDILSDNSLNEGKFLRESGY